MRFSKEIELLDLLMIDTPEENWVVRSSGDQNCCSFNNQYTFFFIRTPKPDKPSHALNFIDLKVKKSS